MSLRELRRTALRALTPPPRIALSQWIEQNIRLPEGVSALPGAVRLWPYQRDHAAAARSSLSAPRITILSASSGSGRCSALIVVICIADGSHLLVNA
jgi:hypothetical protein